ATGEEAEEQQKNNNAQCPMTPVASSRQSRPTHWLPNAQSLIQLAAAVESGTHHPLARAIQQEAQRQELSIPEAVDFHTEPGLGVSALVEGTGVLLGNWHWLNWH
ncbi:MAG: heavy metal translocating P-type ATPase, partial [Nostoc sp.]